MKAVSMFHRLIVMVSIVVWICGFSGLVFAAEQPVPASPPGYLQYQEPSRTAGTTWGTVAYVLSLIVLFLGVILFAYLTSRFVATKMGGIGQSAGTSVHMTLALGPNRNIHLVEMAGRFFVVGATEQSIQLLFEIDSPEQIEKIRDSAKVGKPSFEAALGSQLSALKQMRDKFPGIFSPSGDISHRDDHDKR
jgi:flagellar protein FliO/FliZ